MPALQAKEVNGEYVHVGGRHLYRWRHNGRVVDAFGTEVRKGDRIVKMMKHGGPRWYYILDVQQDHFVASVISGFRGSKHLMGSVTPKLGKPRKHTNCNPQRILIDHEWRKNHG